MSTVEARLSAQDLLGIPDAERFELVDGQLVERIMGAKAAYIGTRLSHLVMTFLDTHPLGWGISDGASFQCYPDDPEKVRRPDGSFIALGRLPGEEIPEGHIRIAPDLAVEVTSPNDLHVEVETKVNEYLEAGVRLVWVVTPETRTVQEYRPGRPDSRRLTEADDLDGGEVLPGFRCRVAEIFKTPA